MSQGVELAEGPGERRLLVDVRPFLIIVGLLVGLIFGWLTRPAIPGLGAQWPLSELWSALTASSGLPRDLAIQAAWHIGLFALGSTIVFGVIGMLIANSGHGTLDLSYLLSFIQNPQDFWGAAALVALGVFCLWAASDLPGIRGFAFGPGTAPRMFAWLLLGLAAVLALVALVVPGPHADHDAASGPAAGAVLVVVYLVTIAYSGKLLPSVAKLQLESVVAAVLVLVLAVIGMRFASRGPLLLTAAVLVFAGTVRPLGLLISSFVAILAAAAASTENRPLESIIWAAVLTAFCAFLFPYALNLPLQLLSQPVKQLLGI